MIDFIQMTHDSVFYGALGQSFSHAVHLVIIDGLCLGIDVAGDK